MLSKRNPFGLVPARCALAALSCLSLLVARANCQDAAAAVPSEPAKQSPFVFEAEERELGQVVSRCANYLEWNVLVDDDAQGLMAGVVAFERPVVVDRAGCEDTLTGLLWRRGLMLLPVDETRSVYEVVFVNGQRGREVMLRAVFRTPEEILARPSSYRMVTTAYSTKYMHAQYANNSLRPFLASAGGGSPASNVSVGNVGGESMLLLSGPQALVAQSLRLLEAADVEPNDGVHAADEARFKALEEQNQALLARLARLEQQLAVIERERAKDRDRDQGR